MLSEEGIYDENNVLCNACINKTNIILQVN